MKTTIHRDIAWASGRWLAAIAVTVPMLSGCDLFWKPCADPSADCLMAASDAGPGTMDQAMPPDMTPTTNQASPLGPPRSFEWRAKESVDPNKRKFVGMNGLRPVFLVKDDTISAVTQWAIKKLDLRKDELSSRLAMDSTPLSFPLPPLLSDFVGSQVVVANNTFCELLKPWSWIECWNAAEATLKSSKLAVPFTYFRHPELDAVAINIQPDSGFSTSFIVGWKKDSIITQNTNEPPASVHVIGDLDVLDRLSNGLEAISIDGFHVQPVLHQEKGMGASLEDKSLQDALQRAIDFASRKSTTPIDAAFITDLNLDGFRDFVYIRGGQLFVTSYLGRNGLNTPNFEPWSSVAFPAIRGEYVASLAAVDLTQDGYPELVVETDKAVHFYLNNP